jgi:hypothetical protein
MRKSIAVAVLGVCFASLAGCAAVGPLPGAVYTDYKFPSLTSQAGPGRKIGTSQARAYLAMVAVGDASVDAACKNGGITKINTVDTKAYSILGIYTTWTTTVTGE